MPDERVFGYGVCPRLAFGRQVVSILGTVDLEIHGGSSKHGPPTVETD